jgi:hypothetical protein
MKILKNKPSDFFGQLLEPMGSNHVLDYKMNDLKVLTLSLIHSGIKSPWGIADLYRLSECYQKNNSDWYNKEMVFFTIDNSSYFTNNNSSFAIYPKSLCKSEFNVLVNCFEIKDSKLMDFNGGDYKVIRRCAHEWLKKIERELNSKHGTPRTY